MAALSGLSGMREKSGTAYSVPRRVHSPGKRDPLSRREDRAGCPRFFALSTNLPSLTLRPPRLCVKCASSEHR